ncbi:MAG TPA: DUF222 domain-containing protein, partial [Acidimicrobiales bacterium]|nr:DUF222 domain-containing protein [Acidimicrobiales bacterium]
AGDRSAAAHLARVTGTSVRTAGEVLETARRLEKLPALAAAARAGALSAAQVAAVADAAVVDPSAESALVETAKSSSLAELREQCGRVKAAARPDAEARRKAIHDQRYLRAWTDAEGAWNLRMRDNPEVGAVVMAAIEAVRDRLFRQGRAEGRREPSEAYAAAEDCTSVAWLENDHRLDWAASHTTMLDLLDRLCSHHHDLKTIDNWALVDGHGKRAFVAPDDPRHPRRPARAA